jgi:hypothetical protein
VASAVGHHFPAATRDARESSALLPKIKKLTFKSASVGLIYLKMPSFFRSLAVSRSSETAAAAAELTGGGVEARVSLQNKNTFQEQSMFFDQIKDLDGNIKHLRDDLKNIAASADAHFDQLDDIAAHVIALEAIVCAMMDQVKVDGDKVQAWVKKMTADEKNLPDGSTKARLIVDQLIDDRAVTGVS